MHKAILFDTGKEGGVGCRLCRHYCVIPPGKTGLCAVRKNEKGKLHTLVYDSVAAAGVDPIEKKPLFHFHPGSLAYSVATMGCNFSCLHCQNASLSKGPADTGRIEGRSLPPEKIVEEALRSGSRSISFTYSEPTVFAELALDTARCAHRRGLATSFVTNGYQSPGMVNEMKGLIDAANVDLKAYSKRFYRDVCGAKFEGVLDTIGLLHGAGLWLEITTLVIPTQNDSEDELRAIARFIAGLDENIPWHVSRFHPTYRMTKLPPTPPETLFRAIEIGHDEGLRHIYAGNIAFAGHAAGRGGEDTFCHRCGVLLIERRGYSVRRTALRDGGCPACGETLAGVFE